MKLKLLGILSLGLFMAGCTTTSSHLPSGARLVGGGLDIEYEAPSNGTVILLERTSGRIVATESLREGSYFEFGSNHSGCNEVIFSMFAAPDAAPSGEMTPVPTNTVFQLYFVPDKAKK